MPKMSTQNEFNMPVHSVLPLWEVKRFVSKGRQKNGYFTRKLQANIIVSRIFKIFAINYAGN